MKINKKPLVSIVTIIFNPLKNGRKEFLIQCLESVHNQSYENIEHLVIDGGSSDGTIELLDKYKEMGWIEYITEKDKGIYDAMNKGVDLSRGKYVAFLNSDDYYHEQNGIKNSIIALEKSNATFSYAPVLMLAENDGFINKNHPHLKPNIKNVYYTMPFCHQTVFIRKNVLVKEGKFNDSFKSAGDYDLVLRLCLKNYTSVFVDNTFATFRLGGISDSNQKQSVEEVARSYYENYGKICKLSKKESEQIYCQNYDGISITLANSLKENRYFDYNKYILEIEKNRKKIIFLNNCCISKTQKLKEITDSRSWKISQFLSKLFKLSKIKL